MAVLLLLRQQFQKPLISYVPYTQKYGNELPNQLGHLAKTKEELQSKLYTIFNNYKSGTKYNS